MKLRKTLCLSSLFLLLITFLTTAVNAVDQGLKITEMAITTKIVRGNPIDSVHRISSKSVKALYCFTRLRSTIDGATNIRHIWYNNDVKVGEYDLPVKGLTWRTYSKKMIDREMVGEWRVEALDSEGHILKTVRFRMN